MKAQLPPLTAALSIEHVEIDAFPHVVGELTIHGYDQEESADAHIYLIVHEIDPLPAPLCRRIRITYPPIDHDSAIELNFAIVSFMQWGAETIFKCEALDADLDARLLRAQARPILEVQEAVDD